MEQVITTFRRRTTTRRAALAGVALGSLLTVAASTAPPAGAQSAPVVRGLVKVESQVHSDSSAYKEEVATCPAGKKVVGGGGWTLVAGSADEERVALTRLEPSDDVDGTGADGYIAAAAETAPGVTGNWWVQAYALCADASSVLGWHINKAYSAVASDPKQQRSVGCDNSGQRVLGTGARIRTDPIGQGEVVLQQVNASAPSGTHAWAQAQEDGTGYGGTWWLGVYAICADTPSGYEVVTGGSAEGQSETFKWAQARCSLGKQLLSAGAFTATNAPGNVSLQQVYPSSRLTQLEAYAVENTPTSLSWGVFYARGVCVDRS
jgi:hypothetical protein